MDKIPPTLRAELDAMHAPEHLTNKTLQAVKAENARLRAQDAFAARTASSKGKKGIFLRNRNAIFALAACFLVMLGTGTFLANRPGVRFSALDVSSLPDMAVVQRSDAAKYTAEEFASATGVDVEHLIDGYTMESAIASGTASKNGIARTLVETVYASGETRICVQLSDFETLLFQAAQAIQSDIVNGADVRFVRDEGTDTLYALWRGDGVYYAVYCAQLSEKEFVSRIKRMIGG